MRHFTRIFSQTVTYIYSVAIIVYCALAAEFLTRYSRDRPMRLVQVPGEVTRGVVDKSLKRMLCAMSAMSIFILIR